MNTIGIVYYSFTGNVLRMVKELEKGIEEVGGKFKSYRVAEVKADEIFQQDIIVMASPANGSEEIEKEFFQPFMENNQKQFQGKKVYIFGSWGWGEGYFLEKWKEQLEEFGAILVAEPILCNGYPNGETRKALEEMGKILVEK